MGRRAALLVVGSLVFALAACGGGGGGGGDEDAFCDSLDRLSEQVADGDLGDEGGLEDATDTASDLLEAASDDQEDAVTTVGEALEEADPDDAADTAELIQDELGDIADDCDLDEFAEAPEEETTTTTEAEETTTTEGEETTTTEGGEEPTGEVNTLGALEPVPADIEAEFAEAANACFVGDMSACDLIFFGSDGAGAGAAPDGSVARSYAASCAGRIAQFVEGQPGECVNNFFLASPPDVTGFTDPSFEGLAQGCFNNDMQSCVDLFQQTGVDTPEEAYGATCGFRVDPTVTTLANCLDIFGPTTIG